MNPVITEDNTMSFEDWKEEWCVTSATAEYITPMNNGRIQSYWGRQTNKTLRQVCKKRGLKKYSKLKKEELLLMLYLDEQKNK